MDDSDQIIDVPDTPDRSANRGKLYHSGKSVLFDEGIESRPIFVNGDRKKLSIGPPNGNAHSGVSLRHTNPPAYVGGSTSSSRNIPIFRRGLAEKMPINESHDSRHGKSSSDGLANNVGKFPFPLREVSGRTDSMYRNGLSVDDGERVESASNIQDKPGKCSFPTLHSNSSPKVNRQKRLVRNGCISPHNIAKAKKVAEKDDDDGVLDNGVVAVAHADTRPMASSGSPVWDDLKQLVAEDSHSHRGKGKGVMNHSSSAKELDNKNKHLFSRNSLRINEKDMDSADHNTGASEIIEIPGGWRSTHDRTRKMSLRSSDNEVFHTRKHHENRLSSKEKGSTVVIDGDYHRHTDSFSTEYSPAQPAGDTTVSHPRSRLGSNGHRYVANTIMKRQRQGSISSSSGEGSSSSTSDDREIVFIRSPGGPSSSRSTSSSVGHRQPVIEIDDSPGPKDNTVDEVARARQLEADEMLARELQEQLYSETPVLGFGEVDEHIALALQHEESGPTVSRGSNHASDPADSLIANVRRQSHSRPSSNFSRRGSQARTSTSGRMTRFRGRFPGQPRTLLSSSSSSSSSRGRNSVFPANMDVDMRMHILETLEAFNDMGVGRGVLRMQRDFNESDYEMLLALDENNDQHSGTSTRIINGLPQSTVQNNNFEEVCAICLETPTVGDTIRHLPCLHKFHKDCIDPWLRRRTSCPVCKSSIT